MKHNCLKSFAVLPCLIVLVAVVWAEESHLKGDWWQQPAVQTRHTIFVATFDRADSNDADFARGMPLAGGFGMTAGVPGRHGKATRIAEKGGHLHYRGGNNFNPHRGTLRMFVKGNVWRDETPHWLFDARGEDRIGILRDKAALSLVFCPDLRTEPPIAKLDLPIKDVTPDEWHCIVASWDRAAGIGAIALDGRCATGPMKFPDRHSPVFIFYVGGGFGARVDGMNLPGLEIDDLVIYDLPLAVLQADIKPLPKEDEALLIKTEDNARKCLNFIADLQRWGGWQTLYTWPTLIGSAAQGRECVDFPEAVGNDKSHASPHIASRFLYAYEVMGDYRFFEIALKTADLLLAAQDPRGFWVHGYRMTVSGIKPAADERHVKLQDSVQSHPIFFLSYLHRLTGDERYMTALKKAGEFYLKAQNPNGSWSHHWDAKDGIGKTARNQPQGGEINDLCTNDAIDVMVLMYHITGERKYIESVKRAGDWFIAAQIKGATRGWAEQYDKDNNPAEARHFEPPACSQSATRLAAQGLVEVYRLSKDDRYLQPIRDCIAWMEKAFPNGEMWCYHDLSDNRPIACWERKNYHMDDEKEAAWVRQQPIGTWQLKPSSTVPAMKRILERAEPPKDLAPMLTAQSAADRLKAFRSGAEQAMATQNEAGVWVSPVVSDFMGSIGAGFGTASPRVLAMLRYIEAARTALGELPPAYRGDGNLLRMAYPKGDWYDVKWDENVK
ncbi:MAG: hypothetical protein AB1696_02375 [Planctomycetota bacterium]